ncbi:hypothetical protein GSI_00098 [Ganoderma sinense ZZ0214-1]|uniref:Uncharacterized protein n=1 Tax=Ganoderma sinense ZZ0214-1 TaxID=1077348 RepID=A0A2G8SRM4_9APHY|nr:hypothetical protein GSI_00098 [Ganoderma sinense ZZ0214-1]
MPSLSPQRSRKVAQSPLGQQGPMQNITPREMTPSPSFREKPRTIKANSMPSVPSLGQVLATRDVQMMYPQGAGQQQPSPTASNSSHQSRRSPPPTSRISPTSSKLASSATERERPTSPAALHVHSASLPQLVSQALPNPHHPRPVPRGAPPAFLNQFQTEEERWAVTDELMAKFEREHMQKFDPEGTSGVAYAGGAASSNLKRHDSLGVRPPAKDPAVERVRATDRASPKDSDGNGSGVGVGVAKRQLPVKEQSAGVVSRESPVATGGPGKGHTRERSGTVTSQQLAAAQGEVRTPEYRGSPQYPAPMASPGERTAGYTQYVPENYQNQGQQQGAQQNVPRKPVPAAVASEASATRLTPPASSKLATNTHTPPLQIMGSRPPDRSLPLQEPEEDNGHDDDEPEYTDRHHGSPLPASDLYADAHTTRYDTRHDRRDDDDETLNEEEGEEHLPQNKNSEDSESGSGFTPRSPSTTLPERTPVAYGPQTSQYAENQKTIRAAKHRSGSTDQLGMRSFDLTMFERDTVNSLRSSGTQDAPPSATRERASHSPQQPPSATQPEFSRQQLPQYDPRQYPISLNNVLDQRMGYGWNHSSVQSDDMQSLFDDPTSSYLQTFLRSASARPGAPIPPTPQSHTAAPSPSPLISATPSDIEPRQIGSPYPYPFTHIRRSTVSGPLQAPSTSYDMNNPAVIREQLALQMQIYALNNGLAPPSSESAFSPSSTPFPGPGYNPWAFVPAGGGLGMNAQTVAASIRSSPSHEPVSLPPPPAMRGRGLRRRDQNGHMRSQLQTARTAARRVKPPPRVDSTQPRETSPEPSSGEETAGEERFVDQYEQEMDGIINGKGREWNGVEIDASPPEEDDGEWVDEEEDGEEDDLLDLEFHPSYMTNPQKRRRRFDTRWDALVQAFQALDRETDATLVVLAAPSHTTKLHSLTSRSLRRDPALLNSTALASVRRSFSHLASQRRAARKAQRMSLAERLSNRSDSSADGSPGSGTPREMDLRRALETALGSLGALSTIYEQREARWRDEMRRLSDDRERVELLLRQALGPVLPINGHAGANINGA